MKITVEMDERELQKFIRFTHSERAINKIYRMRQKLLEDARDPKNPPCCRHTFQVIGEDLRNVRDILADPDYGLSIDWVRG